MPFLAWLWMIFNGTKVKKDGNLVKINKTDWLWTWVDSEEGNVHTLRPPLSANF